MFRRAVRIPARDEARTGCFGDRVPYAASPGKVAAETVATASVGCGRLVSGPW
jgi:hypothetical protein